MFIARCRRTRRQALAQYLVGYDRGRDRRVEAVGPAHHRDLHPNVALILVVSWQSPRFVTDEDEGRGLISRQPIIVGCLEAGADELTFARAKPGDEFRPSGNRDLLGEQSAHRRPDRLDRERIGTIVDEN